MAIDVVKAGNNVNTDNIKEFAVDTAEDILKLPTQTQEGSSSEWFENSKVDTGSTAITSDGKVFYLFPSGWKELK